MDGTPPGRFLPPADDLAIRVELLEIRCKRLIELQIKFVAYCRRQAAAIEQQSECCQIPAVHTAMLRIALRYERMAARTEQLVRRFAPLPDVLDPEPAAREAA